MQSFELETIVKGGNFIFGFIDSFFYKCHKKYESWGIVHRFSPLDKKLKRATINTVNIHDNNCFQYATRLAINHKEIRKNSERTSRNKYFTDKYNWKDINYPSEKDD